jgi:predicted O-methyltransferase YrrM
MQGIEVTPIKEGADWFPPSMIASALETDDDGFAAIERRAAKTNAKGRMPLWDGYRNAYGTEGPKENLKSAWRTSNQVRTAAPVGRFFSRLVQQRRPAIIVEFGTAFGVSGMYWLHGLECVGSGLLYTFEPNKLWQEVAIENLRSVGTRFVAVPGTFEDEIDRLPLPDGGIDIAFVDAIHTSQFVYRQVEMIKARMPRGGTIVLDDINFSDDMQACWQDLSHRPDVAASAEVNGRVGVIAFERRAH